MTKEKYLKDRQALITEAEKLVNEGKLKSLRKSGPRSASWTRTLKRQPRRRPTSERLATPHRRPHPQDYLSWKAGIRQ